ncbi:MAG: thioredoxin domain-containing protein [Bacteroidota bacterium]
MNNETSQSTNALINESSPYLLQHAHNPVKWYPWGPEALNKAKEENKPILLSIGYSSCHWCHVMAHESFENDSIAAIMNENFINIKLDREERPDIDQVYMDAVQAMGLNGGWPLNVFLFPDQKPFYGGTYFPPQNWKKLLEAVANAYKNDRDKLYESALNFTATLNQREAQAFGLSDDGVEVSSAQIQSAYVKLKSRFDSDWGGVKKSPKFPMPAVWQFLLHYYYYSEDQSALEHLTLTLDKIAMGGIYDQVGGGFARYSVDAEWHVPHFEKMLYDNGQLLSLYANGFKIIHDNYYAQIMCETADWLEREMLDDNGGFYSGIDADSEGEEGKFYVWDLEEIKSIAGKDWENISAFFNVSPSGNWEGQNVLRTLVRIEPFCKERGIDLSEFKQSIKTFKSRALSVRDKRIRPGLDTKIISGWNGLVLSGLLDAYQATGNDQFLKLARNNAKFLLTEMIKEDGSLKRTYGSEIPGFMEDYSAVIQAFIKYYETIFDETYILVARKLTDYTLNQFYDEGEKLFFFTSDSSEELIARKKEIFDNVIPSSNSMMAENLYKIGLIFDSKRYTEKANHMIGRVSNLLSSEPEYLSYWNKVVLNQLGQNAEVVILGDQFDQFGRTLQQTFIPDMTLMSSKEVSTLPLFEFKTSIEGKTTIYVCYNKSCKQPVYDPMSAKDQLLGKVSF